MTKLLLKFLPIDTIITYAVNIAIQKLNEQMAKDGVEKTIVKVAAHGSKTAEIVAGISRLLADAQIDEAEKARIMETYVPDIANVVKSVMK